MKVSALQKKELVSIIVGKSAQDTQRDLAQALDIPITTHEKKRVQQDESVRLELTLSKELADKLNKCRDLASHLIVGGDKSASYSELLEVLADSFIKKHSLKQSGKKGCEDLAQEPKLQNQENENQPVARAEKINKTLTTKTKTEVRERDQGCQYVDEVTGRKCCTTFLSQTDHKSSRWAVGDNHSKENLQSLCAAHNQLKYRKESSIRNL